MILGRLDYRADCQHDLDRDLSFLRLYRVLLIRQSHLCQAAVRSRDLYLARLLLVMVLYVDSNLTLIQDLWGQYQATIGG